MRAIVQYPRNISQPTVSELLIMRATQQPSRVAYTFISSDGEEQVTYAELEQRARAIGCQLSELVMRGKPVALLYPPGISYITALFGCICAGAIAVPAYPPDPLRRGRSLPCITAILRDATPSVIMTTSATSGLPFLLEYANRHHVRVLATDYAHAGLPQAWEPVSPDPESAALLQYTSGSTATPKGVVLTHRNLMNNSELIYRFFGHSQDSRGMLWLPPYHDMGLVGGIIQPLYGGFPITLMAPADFMQRPTRWLQEISRIRATTSGGPKFSYDLCVQKTTAEERQQLDLSSWQVAFNGSEPVRAETMERFTQAFGPAGFRREAFHPCYGLAEATLFVTGGVPWSTRETTSVTLQPSPATSSSASARSHRVVSCGLPASSHRLAIVDPSAHVELPSGQVGEIWISGDSVAQAYWRRADESREIFGARLADGSEGSFLRSGDLGFVLGDRLFVTGRMKDLIIMCGFNHYPQDIELTAELSSSVLRPGCGAAFTVTADDEEQLVVAHEVRPGTSTANVGKVTDAIRAAVAAEHGIAVHTVVLLPPGGIPKTSSGKVQRRQCAAMFEDGQLPGARSRHGGLHP